MSTIYVPLPAAGYELCHPVPPATFEDVHLLANGSEPAESWNSLVLKFVRQDEVKELLSSDAPWLTSDVMVFKRNVIESIGNFLKDCGDIIPIKCEDDIIFAYKANIVLDALDEEASHLNRFKNGRVMMVKNYVFRREIIASADVFRITSLRVSPTFLSQRFVDFWKRSNLRGLDFKKIWSSDER